MQLVHLYWLAFGAYSFWVIGIGVYVLRRQKGAPAFDSQSYWSADQRLTGWESGLSISASMMSISWSCVYGVQLFYWYGYGAAWLLIIPWLLTLAGFFRFSPLFRRLKAFSQPELLEKRFGKTSRQLLAPALIFVFIVWGGAEIYAAGITIAPFLGVSVPIALLLIALVVAVYSYTGGFAAVVATDRIQFVLVALFITAMAVIGYSAVARDFGSMAVFSAAEQAPKAVAGMPNGFSPGIALIAMTFLAYLPGWLVETDIWIRLQASGNEREARKGIAIAGVNAFFFVGLMPMLVGLAALVLYPPVSGVIPADLQDGALIFNALMRDYTPAWLNAILGIALVAAAMSTVDTCANVVALSLSYDLLEPALRRRQWPAERLALLARWVSVGAVFLAFVYALFTDSLWDIFYLSSGILTTTVFIPIVAVFIPGSSARQVNAAVLAGFLGTLAGYVLESRGYLAAIEPQWLAETQVGYVLWGLLCSTLAYLLARKNSTLKPLNP